jgi:hypothetical protein
VVNPGFFNGAGNASTRLAWIDNSAVAKGVFKPQENAVLLAFMLMLYDPRADGAHVSTDPRWTSCPPPRPGPAPPGINRGPSTPGVTKHRCSRAG